MQTAAYGIYKDGQILFDEPTVQANNTRALIVFLSSLLKQKNKQTKLADFFNLYGSWEDNRSADTVINDIRQSRAVNSNVQL
ncbi:MAG: hypothetical protein LBJ25_06150 [Candidatus Margulisbacteria bacterium]|jgi:hypothetical protein|nr:hypothetical protein [Candidatus Margulisiibacteriota bacterium]